MSLQQGQRCAHRCLRGHVRHLHVCRGCEPATFLHHRVQEVVQRGAGLLVRQREDVVAQRARANVNVAELTRGDRCVVALDSQASRFEAPGQVAQGACVNELTHEAGSRVGKAADQMEQAKAVGTEAGDVLVVDEVLALQVQFVVFLPVATNRQHGVRATDERHHVRQRNACGLAVFIADAQRVFLDAQVHVRLDQREPIVVKVRKPRFFVLGLVDRVDVLVGRADVAVAIEACRLQLLDVVLGLAHHMRYAVARHDVRRAVWQQDVLCRDEHRHLTAKVRIEIHLLERAAGGRQ